MHITTLTRAWQRRLCKLEETHEAEYSITKDPETKQNMTKSTDSKRVTTGYVYHNYNANTNRRANATTPHGLTEDRPHVYTNFKQGAWGA